MNLPTFVSKSVLDLSKILIYKFYFDYMKLKWCKKNIQLIYIDTDSLAVSIKMDEFFENIKDYFEER